MSTSGAVQFLLIVAVKVTLLLGAAALVDVAVLRRYASATARHLLWSLAVVASLLVPILGQALPALRAPILDAGARLAPPPVTAVTARLAPPTDAAAVSPPSSMPEVPPDRWRPSAAAEPGVTRPMRRFTYADGLLIAYVAGVLLVLVRIAVDHAVVWRITREARPAEDARWTGLLHSLARPSRWRRPVVVLRSSSSVMPLTLGFVRPRVVVPDAADSWPPTMREAVMMHELAHIDRSDCLTQSLAALACALYWPNPLAWWAAARLRVERELACDDVVLARGIRPHEYAAHLLDAARALRTPRLAVSMAVASGLEHRLRAVIDETRRRGVPATRSVVLGAGSMLALAATLAAVRPVPVVAAATPIRTYDASSAESRASVAQSTPVATRSRESLTRSAPAPAAMLQQAGQRGTFSVRPATPADGPVNAGRIHFMLQAPGLNTFYVEPARIDGLTREQLTTVGAPLRFRLRRDAGTFEFTGAVRNGYGAGSFEFVADPAFADSLARRGIRPPSATQQFSLARHDVSLAYVDELATQGYAVPTIEQLVHAGTTGAELVQYRDTGSATAVRPERPARERSPTSSPTSSSEANAQPPLPLVDDTVVTGRWTMTARPGGWLQLDIDWANVNQWRRFVRPPNLAGLGPNDINGVSDAKFRIEQDAGEFDFTGEFARGRGAGQFSFTPNPAFPATLRALGVRGADHVGIHQLKNLGFGFISAASVREFMAAGLTPLTLEDLLELAVRQVSPAYLRDLQASGIRGLDSPRAIAEVKFHNVPAEYAREMSALGYKELTYRQLIDMYRAAVTAGFVRQLQQAGRRDVTAEELIDLRMRRP
jgi:beta-lactamase regulating signal transducer with metallopeptidase domain